MPRCLILALLALSWLPTRADDNLPVKIGETEIILSCPPGMADMPKDDPATKALGDLAPPDCQILRSCVSSEALDTTKAPDPSQNIMITQTFSIKDAVMDIDSADFIDFVQRMANTASHGILVSKDSVFDYEETKKRLAQFQKDTGLGVQENEDVYSLGMVSRSDACVAYMEAGYVNVSTEGKTEREKCVSVVGYLLLKKKVVIAVTSLTKNSILPEDILALKQTAEKYQIKLQILNNM